MYQRYNVCHIRPLHNKMHTSQTPTNQNKSEKIHRRNTNISWSHLCRRRAYPNISRPSEKISLAVCSSRADASIERSRYFTRCNVYHERSKPVLQYNTCIREESLLLKTLSFRHSQSDHIMANAPTLIIVLSLLSIPWSQLSKIFATECGGRMVKEAPIFKDSRGGSPVGKTILTPPIVATNSIAGGPFPSSTIHELDENDDALDFEKTWYLALRLAKRR